jgi:hypothetical protein
MHKMKPNIIRVRSLQPVLSPGIFSANLVSSRRQELPRSQMVRSSGNVTGSIVRELFKATRRTNSLAESEKRNQLVEKYERDNA